MIGPKGGPRELVVVVRNNKWSPSSNPGQRRFVLACTLLFLFGLVAVQFRTLYSFTQDSTGGGWTGANSDSADQAVRRTLGETKRSYYDTASPARFDYKNAKNNEKFNSKKLSDFAKITVKGISSSATQLNPKAGNTADANTIIDAKTAPSNLTTPSAATSVLSPANQTKPSAVPTSKPTTRQTANPTAKTAPVALRKPVSAIMCATDTCRVQTCPKENTPNANKQLPDFLRPFPNERYGYGFIHRTQKHRGEKMSISGTASSGSGCALSHKYQFIFVHVLKSGGTTVKGFLQQGLCGNTNLPCETGTDNLQIVDCSKSIAKYPHYFVFSFVRNPYSRMYSAYAMAHSYRYNPKNPKPPFSFETFAIARHPNTTEAPNAKPATPFVKNKFRTTLSYLHLSHYYPQTHFLFSSKDCPAVDYIGHLETLNDDLKEVLTYIDSPELWKHFQMRMSHKVGLKNDNSTAFGDAKKKHELGDNLQTAYQYKPSSSALESESKGSSWTPIRKAVAEEYKRDFYLLGYDPTVVPP